MRQSFQDSEQRLLRTSANLFDLLAEVQKLREAVQLAEASNRRLNAPPTVKAVEAC
jgi:hypothetical protein